MPEVARHECAAGAAAELERLTPNERAALVQQRVVTDVSQLDAEFVERARAHGPELLEAREILGATQQ